MSANSFIPSGQTSLVKKGKVSLQVQTEYSQRPYPRIKTTIFDSGQVLHKIEKKLERSIESVEEQNRVEDAMKHQHREIVAIIKETSTLTGTGFGPPSSPKELSTKARLAALPGVERVFRLDRHGKFASPHGSEQFRKAYAAVFKGLPVIMEIFSRRPGSAFRRDKGVYEIERDRLYFASTGDEFYFVTIRRAQSGTDYEKSIKEIVLSANH